MLKIGRIKNQSGFTLIEAMITMTILGVTAAGMGTMMQNVAKGQRSSKETADFNSLVNLINSVTMGDSSCGSALQLNLLGTSANKVNLSAANQITPITLNLNGTIVGGSSTYGSTLKNVQVQLTSGPIASFILGQGVNGTGAPGTAWNGVGTTFASVTLGVKAQKVSTGSTLSNGTLNQITVQVINPTGPSNSMLTCSGLRLGNAGSAVSIPTCAAGESAFANGTGFTCKLSSCPTGWVPNGAAIVGTAAAGPTAGCVRLPALGVPGSATANCGTATQTISAPNGGAGLPATSTTINMMPIPYYSNGLLAGFDCGFTSCPLGGVPTYNGNGTIISCKMGETPTNCVPHTASVSMSTGMITYGGWTCDPPASLNQTGLSQATNYYCSENCSTKAAAVVSGYFPNLVGSSGTALASCVNSPISGTIVDQSSISSGGIAAPSTITLSPVAGSPGLFTTPATNYTCKLSNPVQTGTATPMTTCPIGTRLAAYVSTPYNCPNPPSLTGSFNLCPGSAPGPGANQCAAGTSTSSGLVPGGITPVFTASCSTGSWTGNGGLIDYAAGGCASCGASPACSTSCNLGPPAIHNAPGYALFCN